MIFYFAIGKWVEEKCAFSYYTVFLNQSVSEEYLQDPIKEAGYAIGPLLSANISNKEMKFRRYAISALGDIGYRPATPVLRNILFDQSEPDYIRADACEVLTRFN
ncbi:HEAT repeat domain-containing protein [Hymenobacter siberiensis]|uniref:HEAT repeat domain-containing protein n=1 Tax=Hymenobacter siberiensis TaxID=2848396 RepID=UPI001C1E7F5E|nr:HEAT repeat domain-containing protein [Hymenobacter siberiensis]MBU6121193.1 HEAT repeat domain-containing protein [Hymenobacter siberiensis]